MGRALAVWAVMGMLSAAGALCYAELATRFPQAGGGYVFLREAFGPRVAFVYGWMALLVMDPGLTAALAIGLAQYLLAAARRLLGPHHAHRAIAAIVAFGLLTLAGIGAERPRHALDRGRASCVDRRRARRRRPSHARRRGARRQRRGLTPVAHVLDALAGAVIAAFFAFGGWWELGRMSGEVETPRRTMPIALVGGVALVTVIYALVSLAFMLPRPGRRQRPTKRSCRWWASRCSAPTPDDCSPRWSSWPSPAASRRCCSARRASTWRWRAMACSRHGSLDSTTPAAPRRRPR